MKKILVTLLAICLAVSCFAACSKKEDDSNVLIVATSPDFAPMEFVDASKSDEDSFVGFDISLAKYIAEELGMELKIEAMSFDACQTAVELGAVDMSISGFSWTEKRAENCNLSDYYHAGENEDQQVVITTKENEGKYKTAEDFVGVKVGCQTASLQEQFVDEQLPGCIKEVFVDLSTGLMQLKNGDFECMAVAKGNGDVFITNNPDEVAPSGFTFYVDEKYTGNVIMLQKGNDELTEKVNEILAKAEAAGLYTTWYEEATALAGSDNAKEISYTDDGKVAD